MSLDHFEQLEAAIARLGEQVDRAIAPFSAARELLDSITGVGKGAAESIIAEIGTDMSRFPSAGHLASWAGSCPGNNVTGGKRHSGKTTKGDRWLGEILVECAWAASRTRNTYLASRYLVDHDIERTRRRAVAQLESLGSRVILDKEAALHAG